MEKCFDGSTIFNNFTVAHEVNCNFNELFRSATTEFVKTRYNSAFQQTRSVPWVLEMARPRAFQRLQRELNLAWARTAQATDG